MAPYGVNPMSGYRVITVNEHGQWTPSSFVFATKDEAHRFGLSLSQYRDSFEVEQCEEHAAYIFTPGNILYAHNEFDWA
jgi:hypothetical protein